MKDSTINKSEVEKFTNLANEWWKYDGKFKTLHKFNPVRLDFIINQIKRNFNISNVEELPLAGLKILDIGCGGGLMCEPLARLGADVTGIDAVEKNIKSAQIHAETNNLKINYILSTVEELPTTKKYDIILNLEVIEHVENQKLFISKSCNLVSHSGLMFIATINKTLKSYIFAIVGAEYILRWLPIGTHDWNFFVEPDKLIKLCKQNSLSLNKLDGIKFHPLKDRFEISNDKSVNYIAEFFKN